MINKIVVILAVIIVFLIGYQTRGNRGDFWDPESLRERARTIEESELRRLNRAREWIGLPPVKEGKK